MSEDGFAALSRQLTAMNVSEKISKKGLTDAANDYVKKLRPTLPHDPLAPKAQEYGTLGDNLKVIDKGDHVQVSFGDAFWWLFLEHGTANGIRAYNFAHSTFETNRDRLKEVMIKPTMDALRKH